MTRHAHPYVSGCPIRVVAHSLTHSVLPGPRGTVLLVRSTALAKLGVSLIHPLIHSLLGGGTRLQGHLIGTAPTGACLAGPWYDPVVETSAIPYCGVCCSKANACCGWVDTISSRSTPSNLS